MSACPTTFATAGEPDSAIRAENIFKAYQSRSVINGLSLEVNSGEVFGLVGPNGAGKTTLMKMIAGLSRPSAGQISVFGYDGLTERQHIRKLLGWVPQDNNLERELTVRESLLWYARLHGVREAARQVDEGIRRFDLAEMADQKVSLLSGGMARRMLIVRAILPSPRLLLLDEPTVGLDPDVRQEIWECIRVLAAEGTTIFLTTHYMDEADQLCDRLALLQDGKILVTGTPECLKQAAEEQENTAFTLEAAFLRLVRRGAG